jgi:UDP-glucose 4-epimerase
MLILVTGGAGYIGSHIIKQLQRTGDHTVFSLDNLSTGDPRNLQDVYNFPVDLGDAGAVEQVMKGGFDAVIHCASSAQVEESMARPLFYYQNNVTGALNLLHAAVANNVKHFIFSSSAAVYGEPESVPVTEDSTTNPINPYGRSKLMIEQILEDVCSVSDMNYVALRYFNVAGADPKGEIGQSNNVVTHLIKIAAQAATGKRDSLTIYGNNYPTRDGTCERDYVHVTDLAQAHVDTLNMMLHGGSGVFNVGYGQGYTVREVLTTMQSIKHFTVNFGFRRPGDPAVLVGDPNKFIECSRWQPKYNDLRFICQSAIDWEEKNKEN